MLFFFCFPSHKIIFFNLDIFGYRKTKFRYILARCDNYEKQLSDLLQSLSLYTRRTAKLRDSGDCVSDSFSTLATSEAVNPAFKRATLELSKTIRSIEDHRDSQVLYFEEKLLTSLSHYGENLQRQKVRLTFKLPENPFLFSNFGTILDRKKFELLCRK